MIFYLISSISKNNPGLGGHYFSLMHIAEAVSEEKDVAIVNILGFRSFFYTDFF